MPGIRPVIATIAVCGGLLLASRARAEPAHAALIVGNATYASLPGITACARSANVVSAALRALGFAVTERQDASTGGIDAGIGEFSQNLAGGKATGLIYICGYAADFNDRTFVLPTTANIARPSDLLTQGILAKTMLTTVSRDPETAAVVVFDLVPKPDTPPTPININALAGLPVPDGVGVMAVTETPPLPDGPTPLAAALAAAITGPTLRTDALLAGVASRLAAGGVSMSASHMPARSGFLVGAPPPESRAVAAPVVAQPPIVAAPPPPVAQAAAEQLPDEADMTEADRRKVQGALARLGYYDLPVDGVFGPETRAAMRRYQHEIGVELTGHLTAEQATRLVATR